MSKSPWVTVCAGGGGVGKTTSSAALSMALARNGARTLVVTIDPARRLAGAMGISLGNEVQAVEVDPGSRDRLYALMPDPVRASRIFMEYLFAEEPESLQRLLDNGLFLTLEDKLVGMIELVAMTIVMKAIDEMEIDAVVVDTAPSRYALDFLTYPARLSSLLDGRAVKWLSALADRADENKKSRFSFGRLGRKSVEVALGKVLGESLVTDTTGVFAEIGRVRTRFAGIADRLGELLLGRHSRHLLVAAPTGAAQADVEFLLKRLQVMKQRATAVLLNRSDLETAEWTRILRTAADVPDPVRDALIQLEDERSARIEAAETFARGLQSDHPKVQQLRLPLVEANDPVMIVQRLAKELEPHVTALTGFAAT